MALVGRGSNDSGLGGTAASQSGPILSECDGRMRQVVIHYEPGAKDVVLTAYGDFLRALDPDVMVHVVCPTRAAFDELCSLLGPTRGRLSPVIVGHPITTWSRDRWCSLAPGIPGGPITLWTPRGESGEEIWPSRAGDQRVASDIAAVLAPDVRSLRSALYFDAGDFLADSENVFVVPRVLQRNIQQTVNSREELLGIISARFKRRAILLEQSPDHHAGMFMASVGNRTMLVADPGLGKKIAGFELGGGHRLPQVIANLPGGADFTSETQRLFDAVANQCAAAGYRVIRIPGIPAADGRTYLTYVNVLLERQGTRRIVYLPFYRGAEALNTVARDAWQALGYEIRPVDCTDIHRHFGCLHCLVNVLERGFVETAATY
jgi:hypothetical protein